MRATRIAALVICLALVSPALAGEQTEPQKAGIEEKKVMRGGAYLGIAFRVRDRGKSELVYFRAPGVEGDEHTIQYIARGMKNFDK